MQNQDREQQTFVSNNQPSSCQKSKLSIATPAVTTIMQPDTAGDTSFMLPTTPIHQEAMIEKSFGTNKETIVLETENTASTCIKREQPTSKDTDNISRPTQNVSTHPESQASKPNSSQPLRQPNTGDQSSEASQEDGSKMAKKRSKTIKKSAKLDAKSKLEKSRQSARECRARKKLRYQYLEDLVCNREKAVVKLRDELSMFCELSKQLDAGTLSEPDRSLLLDRTREITHSDTTKLV